MKPYVLFFIILLLFGAIGCRKHPVASEKTETSDCTKVVTKERLVTVNVPGDTVVIEKQIPCPDMIKTTVKGKHSSASTEIKDGKLKTECICDEYKAQIEVKDSIITRMRKEKISQTKVVTEYKVYWYDKACRWIVLLIALYVIGIFIYTVYKRF